MRKLLITLFIFTWMLQASAQDAIQSLSEIKQSVQSFLAQKITPQLRTEISIEIGYLDPRLQLPVCPKEKLQFSIPSTITPERASTVNVICDQSWSIFVPVKVNLVQEVVVAARNIKQGELLAAQDVKIAAVNLNRLQKPVITDPFQIENKIAKQSFLAGSPLSPEQLASPQAVQKGDLVTIVAKSPQLIVSMPGVAQSSGAIGDFIKVQNFKSKRIIDAEVINAKEVKVTLPTVITPFRGKKALSEADNLYDRRRNL